jgi:hypothetical protein
MYGEASGLCSFAKLLELLRHPIQSFREQNPRFLCYRATVFLQFRAQSADRAATSRKGFTVLNLDVHKGAKPVFR